MIIDKYEIEKEARNYGELNNRIDRYTGGVHLTTKVYSWYSYTVTVTYINGSILKVEIE